MRIKFACIDLHNAIGMAMAVTKDQVHSFSGDELCEYLESQNVDPDIIETVKKNKISGASFLQLTEDHLKEMFPVIGERMCVSQLLQTLKGPQLTVSPRSAVIGQVVINI